MLLRLPRRLHRAIVQERRTERLASLLADVVPRGARVLDVGCGDGHIARRLAEKRPDLTEVCGIDTVVRGSAAIPVEPFDGARIPHPDDSFDAALLVDVLHHTDDPAAVLRETRRVVRRCIVIKDHTAESGFAHARLRFMDRLGNPAHIDFPYNYWPRARWEESFQTLDLRIASWREELGLFPPALDWAFGRGLHFVARLDLP